METSVVLSVLKKNVAKQSSLVNRAREVVPSPAFLAAFLAIPPPE